MRGQGEKGSNYIWRCLVVIRSNNSCLQASAVSGRLGCLPSPRGIRRYRPQERTPLLLPVPPPPPCSLLLSPPPAALGGRMGGRSITLALLLFLSCNRTSCLPFNASRAPSHHLLIPELTTIGLRGCPLTPLLLLSVDSTRGEREDLGRPGSPCRTLLS